jgi:hypothetical protein
MTNISDFQTFMTYCLHKVYFQVKIKLFETAKSEKDPDPHWFGFQQPDPDLHWFGSLEPDPGPQRGKKFIRTCNEINTIRDTAKITRKARKKPRTLQDRKTSKRT